MIHFGCGLTRWATRCALPRRHRCTGVINPCTSRQAVHAADPWRWGEVTPEMERAPGARPGVRILRSGDPVQCPIALRGKFLKSIHRGWTSVRAARSLQKNKKARNLSVSGPLQQRAWRYAPTRSLHPVAPGPHQPAPTSRLAWRAWGSGADRISTAGCRGRGTTRRARTSGPMRVECWCGSGLRSRWFLLAMMKLGRLVPRRKWTVNSLYCDVNRLDNLFLSRCCCF